MSPPMPVAAQGWRHRLADWAAQPRLVLALVATVALALAMARLTVPWAGTAGAVVMVVDITQSMNVADVPERGRMVRRLEHVRGLLRDVVRALPCGHEVGLGVFTERRTQVLIAPVEACAHYAALEDTIGAIDTRMAWAADSHLYYGVYHALDTLAARWPGAALAFFTDGHQAPRLFPGREPRYQKSAATPPGWLFAVGSNVPQPVPKLDAEGRVAGYWTAEEASSYASNGAPTLSVLDMERMAAGGDVRNGAQRAPGSDADHLSARGDAVLADLASRTGLEVTAADDAAGIVERLRAQPGPHATVRRIPLHDPLVALGALALAAGFLPGVRRWRSVSPSAPLSSYSSSSLPDHA